MNTIYNVFSKNVLQGLIHPENESFKVALFTNEYEPSSEHTLISNLSGYEITATGYEKGGNPVAVKEFGLDSDYIRYGADTQVKWTSNNLTCKYAILYISTSGLLAACYDLGDIHLNDVNSVLTLDWTSSYMLSFRVTASTDLNARRIRDDIYQYIIDDPTSELKESVRDYVIKDREGSLNEEDALKKNIRQYVIDDKEDTLKKATHDYIIENSDTELDEESTNTIQNSAILGSTSGMKNSDIDNMFN